MQPITVSLAQLRYRIEAQAYAYGISPTVGALLGEDVVEFLRTYPPALPKT